MVKTKIEEDFVLSLIIPILVCQEVAFLVKSSAEFGCPCYLISQNYSLNAVLNHYSRTQRE